MMEATTHASRALELIAQYPGVAIAAVVIFFGWLYGYRPRDPDEERGFWHFGQEDESDERTAPVEHERRRKRPF